MYLLFLIISYCFAYFVLLWLYTYFFKNEWPAISRNAARSVCIIGVTVFITITLSLSIPDTQLSNRTLHALGGGFCAVLLCFLVAEDVGYSTTRFQFIVWSALIVTALGTVNELLEFFLQTTTQLTFASTINDTWLDLLSNTIGMMVGVSIFAPLVKKR